MRHAMPPRMVGRHRPRPRSASRARPAEARASDIVLAITGIVVLGALALYAALLLVERAVPG
ncbi:hypothetical protein [Methylobacterium marchantiae]|uniref:Potassium-transporting ATPase subunit F n=1 Tax=Methylobacterium marchantiae TaxID=600331 RepID=A0ABW3X2C5_9HYPH|nr:hypothetical protein AIGOOFII_2621 [Methylobacterium marchantiae]